MPATYKKSMELLLTDDHSDIRLPAITGNAMVVAGSGMVMTLDDDDLQLEPIVDLDETAEAEQVSTVPERERA